MRRSHIGLVELIGFVMLVSVCYICGRSDGEKTQIQRCEARLVAEHIQ